MAMMMDPSGVSGAGTSADPAAAAGESAGDQEAGAFSVEIEVDSQGNFSVSLESADQESAEGGASEDESQATPARNLADALKIAKEMIMAEMGEGPSQSAWNEEAEARQGPTATAGY